MHMAESVRVLPALRLVTPRECQQLLSSAISASADGTATQLLGLAANVSLASNVSLAATALGAQHFQAVPHRLLRNHLA